MKMKHWLTVLLGFAAPCRAKMAASVAAAVIGVAGGLIPYFAAYKIIEHFIIGDAAAGIILKWCGVGMAGYFIQILGYGISTVLSHISAYTILEGLRNQIADRLMKASLGAAAANSIGKLKGIIVEQVEGIEPPLAHMIPELFSNLLLPLGVIAALFAIDFRIGLATLVTVPAAAIPLMVGMRSFHEKYGAYMDANAHVNSVIVEYVEGIEVVKAFNQGSSSYEKFVQAVTSFHDFTMAWFQSTWKSMNLVLSILPTTLLGTLPVGIALYLRGSLTPARLALCLMLALGIVAPLMKGTQFINEMKAMEYAVTASRELLDLESLPQATDEVQLNDRRIKFERVSFSYTGEEQDWALEEISLDFPEASFTALVGPSGGGKSTIARLLSRFWDVSQGRVMIGGIDIREIPLKQLSGIISYVTQDNFLFDCSLKENIRLGNPRASDEEVYEAAKAAQCEEFISRLEKGWDTPAGEAGKQLSGGERQRIAIARAILKDAPVVILDEATAFTDPENEAKIQRSIMELSKGKTLIVIAHRLSTIKNADQIVVIEKGRVADQGRQEELLERCSLYQELWQAHVVAKHWAVSNKEEAGSYV